MINNLLNFKKAYSSANELLCSSEAIDTFPFFAANDREENKKAGVHFFVDDYRFKGIYNNPERTLKKYAQYKFLLTPDFSTYADMNLWRQLESVAKNRWIGAYWQSKGLTVIPTISWGLYQSYEFCFDGVEKSASLQSE